mmetsp:Transcript_40181/g.90690  ORF Transcript_40181/g.90690 Transcript_40181/m.90690 type:complete len:265 (+) Transcript_40181:246-1040(+)
MAGATEDALGSPEAKGALGDGPVGKSVRAFHDVLPRPRLVWRFSHGGDGGEVCVHAVGQELGVGVDHDDHVDGYRQVDGGADHGGYPASPAGKGVGGGTSKVHHSRRGTLYVLDELGYHPDERKAVNQRQVVQVRTYKHLRAREAPQEASKDEGQAGEAETGQHHLHRQASACVRPTRILPQQVASGRDDEGDVHQEVAEQDPIDPNHDGAATAAAGDRPRDHLPQHGGDHHAGPSEGGRARRLGSVPDGGAARAVVMRGVRLP